MSCSETDAAYKSFMKGLFNTRKGAERTAYMQGHKDANQYFLDFIDALPENERSAFDKLKKGAEYVVNCIERLENEEEGNA